MVIHSVDTHEASWGDLLRAQDIARTQLPWKQAEKVNYITRYEKSRQERTFDPVLQKYRNSDRESQLIFKETSDKIRGLNSSKARQLQRVQSHNIISHSNQAPWVEVSAPPVRYQVSYLPLIDILTYIDFLV